MMHRPGHREAGAALLLFMLLLVVGASYILLDNLEGNVRKYIRQSADAKALSKAKAALIGYAVNYPEGHAGEGPGYLPCPDINDDGTAGTGCKLASGNTVGRLPFKTLEISDLRDDAGERLWYAVADNYKNNPKVPQLNSTTPGNFTVDGRSDVVAVIFAPGTSLPGQDRSGSGITDVTNYLEGDNADNDNDFVTRAAGNFNDHLITITRRELMDAVEKRVIGQVRRTLLTYRSTYGAFPWLAPFGDPATSKFHGQVGTWKGQLPFHLSTDGSPRNPFTSDLTISWSGISGATLNQTDDTVGVTLPAPTTSCTTNSQCSNSSDPFYNQIPANLPISGATCTWSNRDTFNCSGSYSDTVNAYVRSESGTAYGYKNAWGTGWVQFYATTPPCTSVCSTTSGNWKWTWAYFPSNYYTSGWGTYNITKYMQGDLNRQYDFAITFTDGNGATVHAPTAGTVRTRDLDTSGSLATASVFLTVTDTWTLTGQWPDYGVSTKQSVTTLTGNTSTTGSIAAAGIKYDIDIDGGELPAWFVNNGWQDLIYVAYSEAEPLPGDTASGQDCKSLGGPCLTLKDCGATGSSCSVPPGNNINDIRALVMGAGRQLSFQDRTSSPGTLSSYFENENSTPANDNFEKGSETSTFDDKIRIVKTAP